MAQCLSRYSLQMARPPKQFESLIQPSVVAQSKPSPALQWTTAPSASRKAPDTPERPADTQPSSTQKLQPTAKMPPIPSKAALAAAQARSAAVWSKANQAAPASQDAASMPVKAAAKPKPDAAPKPKAAAMPPIPSRAALAAAQVTEPVTLSVYRPSPRLAVLKQACCLYSVCLTGHVAQEEGMCWLVCLQIARIAAFGVFHLLEIGKRMLCLLQC